jgi:hypothetical protein
VLLDTLDVGPSEFEAGTGWSIKPEGACKGDVCVPLGRTTSFDLRTAAERLRMALVHDESAGLWALGPEALGDRALVSAEAPELVLDDLAGNEFRLSGGLRAVDVATMTDPHDLDHEPVVEHLIDDPVVAHSHSIGVRLAGQRHAPRRPRVLGQQIDRGANPLLLLPRERGESLDRPASDLDPVGGHTRPRSALTSSQGT